MFQAILDFVLFWGATGTVLPPADEEIQEGNEEPRQLDFYYAHDDNHLGIKLFKD